MKALLLFLGLASLSAGFLVPGQTTSSDTTLVVAGDFLGYLSPCGCTKPMAGGVRRWSSAVKAFQNQGPTVVVVNGGLVDGIGRQDELKAEALAESFRFCSVAAINLSLSEAKLGRGLIDSIHRLSGEVLSTNSLEPSDTLSAKGEIESGPFLIGSVSTDADQIASRLNQQAIRIETSVDNLVNSATSKGLTPVLLYSGNESGARDIAKQFPKLAAIVYRSSATNMGELEKVGNTALITPGERCRELIAITWNGKEFGRYQRVSLGPEIKNEPDVSDTFAHYLDHVDREKLIDAVPRKETAAYAGSDACMSCHMSAAEVWKASEHSHALKSLEDDGHGRDPDCVGCHVVGLQSTSGFKDRVTTPSYANVGCESCHGPAKEHALNPKQHKIEKAGVDACLNCHIHDHSPKFDFSTYWPKIQH